MALRAKVHHRTGDRKYLSGVLRKLTRGPFHIFSHTVMLYIHKSIYDGI